MLNSEKRVQIREYARLVNKIDKTIGLFHGLMSLPNLSEEIRKVLLQIGCEMIASDNQILREDPKEAYEEACSYLMDILEWFIQHPTLKLVINDKNIDAVSSLNRQLKELSKVQKNFIRGYLNGDFPGSINILADCVSILRKIELWLLREALTMAKSLPVEEKKLAAMEFLALSDNKGSPTGLMVFEAQSKLVN